MEVENRRSYCLKRSTTSSACCLFSFFTCSCTSRMSMFICASFSSMARFCSWLCRRASSRPTICACIACTSCTVSLSISSCALTTSSLSAAAGALSLAASAAPPPAVVPATVSAALTAPSTALRLVEGDGVAVGDFFVSSSPACRARRSLESLSPSFTRFLLMCRSEVVRDVSPTRSLCDFFFLLTRSIDWALLMRSSRLWLLRRLAFFFGSSLRRSGSSASPFEALLFLSCFLGTISASSFVALESDALRLLLFEVLAFRTSLLARSTRPPIALHRPLSTCTATPFFLFLLPYSSSPEPTPQSL
mmetsp:Transcript_7852/g.33034  ORF Transcript_7852/g.33034 Transcript_7852/m.33034 type:complete len:305 (-) Transcript_7852:67-981(-)